MAPSAHITVTPGGPAPSHGSSGRFGYRSNGHTQGSTERIPSKSNLKQTSVIPSSSHSGIGSSILEGKEVSFGDSIEDGGCRGQGEGGTGCKVQWVDNYGKDLTQVFEFEPSSDSDDSEDDDSDSSQACSCVIQ